MKHFSPVRAVTVLTFVLFLNYVDRGIIAGAATDIRGCVASRKQCAPIDPGSKCDPEELLWLDVSPMESMVHAGNSSFCDQCRVCGEICNGKVVTQTGFGISTTRLGILQSVFMVGYMTAAIVFAKLVTKFKPFKLIATGLWIWTIATFLSGICGFLCHANGEHLCWAYDLMIFARALSGIGEASLNTLSLPFLDDILDPEKKGFYIGIYYTAIPVGTAFGFMWSGMITLFTNGAWEYAFILEAPFMIPFAFLLYFVPFEYKTLQQDDIYSEILLDDGAEDLSDSSDDSDVFLDPDGGERRLTSNSVFTGLSHRAPVKRIGFRKSVWACLTRPAFVLGALGYAVYTGVVAGLGFYGPTFLQNYRPCDSRWDITQTAADFVFGIIISLSGLLGTIIGGFAVDRISTNQTGQKNRDELLKQILYQITFGFIMSSLALAADSPFVFFLFLFLGACAIFMVSSGINMLLMWTVPKVYRPMASALTVLAIHLFGDVPSPIIIGFISDVRSPKFTLTATIGSILLVIFLWSIILLLPSKPKLKRRESEISRDILDDSVSQRGGE